MHLHELRLDKKPRLAASAPAYDDAVLVSGVFRILRAAAHGEPLRLGKEDVVIRILLIHERLDVLCISPPGRPVLHAVPVFLCVLCLVGDHPL